MQFQPLSGRISTFLVTATNRGLAVAIISGALFLLPSWTILAAQEVPGVSGLGYLLGVGDVITVVVWKEPDLSTTIPIRPDGLVSLPLVGELQAAGNTPEVLRKEIGERLGQFVKAPTVSVVVTQINSLKVYILGEVTSPGAFDLNRPIRLMQVLAMADGLTEYAKKDQVVVLRAEGLSEKRLVVSIKEIAAGRALESNIWLQPGDTVIVP